MPQRRGHEPHPAPQEPNLERDRAIKRRQLMLSLADQVVSEYFNDPETSYEQALKNFETISRMPRPEINNPEIYPEFAESRLSRHVPSNVLGLMAAPRDLAQQVAGLGDEFPSELLEIFLSQSVENPEAYGYIDPSSISPDSTIAHELSHVDSSAFPPGGVTAYSLFGDGDPKLLNTARILERRANEATAKAFGAQYRSGEEGEDRTLNDLASYIKFKMAQGREPDIRRKGQ